MIDSGWILVGVLAIWTIIHACLIHTAMRKADRAIRKYEGLCDEFNNLRHKMYENKEECLERIQSLEKALGATYINKQETVREHVIPSPIPRILYTTNLYSSNRGEEVKENGEQKETCCKSKGKEKTKC